MAKHKEKVQTAATPEVGTREKLKQTALRLFAKQGYTETSTKQICDEAGANIAAVTYHFGTKENLLNSLFSEQMLADLAVFDVILKEVSSVEAFKIRIRMLCEAFFELRLKNPDFDLLIQREALRNSIAFETFRTGIQSFETKLHTFLKMAKKKKILAVDADITMTGFLLLGVVTGTVLNGVAVKMNPELDVSDKKKREAYLDRILHLFFYGTLSLKENA